jgi:hypothetical protein
MAVLCGSVGALLATATVAQAGTLFTAVLNGGNEVPAVDTPANGSVHLILNDDETEAEYMIEFAALSAAETGAHFHVAPPGANGGVTFALPLGTPKNGTWMLTPEDVTNLKEGNIYVNIHTEAFPGGEIRGNLAETPTPAEEMTWGRVKSLFD